LNLSLFPTYKIGHLINVIGISAMHDVKTSEVIGIINKVFVQQSKETMISKTSGITYAVPVKYLHNLLKKHNIKG
jgi:serine protease Do